MVCLPTTRLYLEFLRGVPNRRQMASQEAVSIPWMSDRSFDVSPVNNSDSRKYYRSVPFPPPPNSFEMVCDPLMPLTNGPCQPQIPAPHPFSTGDLPTPVRYYIYNLTKVITNLPIFWELVRIIKARHQRILVLYKGWMFEYFYLKRSPTAWICAVRIKVPSIQKITFFWLKTKRIQWIVFMEINLSTKFY